MPSGAIPLLWSYCSIVTVSPRLISSSSSLSSSSATKSLFGSSYTPSISFASWDEDDEDSPSSSSSTIPEFRLLVSFPVPCLFYIRSTDNQKTLELTFVHFIFLYVFNSWLTSSKRHFWGSCLQNCLLCMCGWRCTCKKVLAVVPRILVWRVLQLHWRSRYPEILLPNLVYIS